MEVEKIGRLDQGGFECSFITIEGIEDIVSQWFPRCESEYTLSFTNGEYVKFTGTPCSSSPPNSPLGVDIANVAIIERGNIYDRQGAD